MLLGACIVLFAAITAVLGQRITIDTVEDLALTPGWIVTCDRGYQRNVSDFLCHNRLRPNIPTEDLNGEVGFWTGCYSACLLSYTLKSTDTGVGFRAYLSGAQHMVLLLNDVVYEHVAGTKWININLDITFIRTVGFYMPEITSDSFVMLDKVYIDPEIPTTTTSTTTIPTTTTPTTISPTTNTPTTTSPTTTTPTTTSPTTTTPTTTIPTTTTPTTTIPTTTTPTTTIPTTTTPTTTIPTTTTPTTTIPTTTTPTTTIPTTTTPTTTIPTTTTPTTAIPTTTTPTTTSPTTTTLTTTIPTTTTPTTTIPTTTAPTSTLPPPERVEVDIRDDIPENGLWNLDCSLGYATVPDEFNCEAGRVNFPPEDLNGEFGFWTKCGTRCVIKYFVQPQDMLFTLRLYQQNVNAEISYDGQTWSFINGQKWVNTTQNLVGSNIKEVSVRLDHFSEIDFVLLDKITINGHLN